MLDETVATMRDTDRVVRGVVALLGIASLGIAAYTLVSIVSLLSREPATAAEAHAMAHSVAGVMVAGIVGVGGGSVVGLALLTIAYVDRDRLSAATLVVVGLAGLLFVDDWIYNPRILVAFVPIVLGTFALYEEFARKGAFDFVSGVTAWLWFPNLLVLVGLSLGTAWLPYTPVPVGIYMLLGWLVDAGAFAILAGAVLFHVQNRPTPRAPLVLAVAIVTFRFVPGPVWSALSDYVVVGLDPLSWVVALTATVAAVRVLQSRVRTTLDGLL